MAFLRASRKRRILSFVSLIVVTLFLVSQDTSGVDGLSTTDRQVTLSDLRLDPTLRNNGGSTQTLALLLGSLAIDAVPLEVCHVTTLMLLVIL